MENSSVNGRQSHERKKEEGVLKAVNMTTGRQPHEFPIYTRVPKKVRQGESKGGWEEGREGEERRK
jgi:hypothetical protein